MAKSKAVKATKKRGKRLPFVVEDMSARLESVPSPLLSALHRVEGGRLSNNFLVGMAELPEDGKPFSMHYHCRDGELTFGRVVSYGPIHGVSIRDSAFHFRGDGPDDPVEWALILIPTN